MMCLVSHSHVLHDTQEQFHNPLCGYVYIYHISNTFHNHCVYWHYVSNPQSVMLEVVIILGEPPAHYVVLVEWVWSIYTI